MKKKNFGKIVLVAAGIMTGAFAVLHTVGKRNKKKNEAGIDDDNQYLNKTDDGKKPSAHHKTSGYERVWKPIIDKALSFAGLVVLAPIYGLISLAIVIDDPGPVLFTQKRVGKDKHFFKLHKFRSMKMSTPHDTPTHLLENPEQYITRVGKFLRKTSLDELPQIWDIFVGNMSIIGPRPALWNQGDLVEERDKWGANNVTPGLTGWAQINGRDELEIPDKAKLDGDYVAEVEKGGLKALLFDIKCFFGTISSVANEEGVVEGGTGKMKKGYKLEQADLDRSKDLFGEEDYQTGKAQSKWPRDGEEITPESAGFADYGFLKQFDIDLSSANHKKVLITGAGSFVGEAFKSYAEKNYPDSFEITEVGTKDGSWRELDFTPYDCVYHVAGIAHADAGHVDQASIDKYYVVNTDLAIEVAEKAKAAGVKQFIFMSSAIIYGESAPYGKQKMIGATTLPAPANFYGDSKWQADKGVRALTSEDFSVAVLRPPMIYGKNSKGNYPTLAKLAKKLPLFPYVNNSRSMLHIDNLCEFMCKLILSSEGGIYFPQNPEYTKTSSMVKEISRVSGKKIRVSKVFSPVVTLSSHIPGKVGQLVDKAFGNLTYDQKISTYNGLHYQIRSLKESVVLTEGRNSTNNLNNGNKPHILVVSQYFYPEQFKINDITSEWVKRGYKVTVLTGIPNYPQGEYYEGYDLEHHRREKWKGMEIIRIPLRPRKQGSVNLALNYFSFVKNGWLWKITNDVHADIVFTYEVSPMTQALVSVWYAKKYHIPHFLWVTDLWPDNVEIITGVHNKVFLNSINVMANYIYKHSDIIFTSSRSFITKMVERGVPKEKLVFWPQYAEDFYKPYEKKSGEDLSTTGIPQDDIFNIVFAGNIGYAQGLGVTVEAAKLLKKDGTICRFNIIGDGRYKEQMKEEIRIGNVEEYFNFISSQPAESIPKFMAAGDAAFICLSKSEVFAMTIPGKTQTCLACGVPIIVSADGEVQEIIEEAKCGLTSASGDAVALAKNIESMMNYSIGLDDCGKNAERYYTQHFQRDRLLNEMDEYFSKAKDF